MVKNDCIPQENGFSEAFSWGFFFVASLMPVNNSAELRHFLISNTLTILSRQPDP